MATHLWAEIRALKTDPLSGAPSEFTEFDPLIPPADGLAPIDDSGVSAVGQGTPALTSEF